MPAADSFTALLQSCRHAPCWWVAFSGGLDSTVLLHRLWQFTTAHGGPPLRAVHVHHGLQAAADGWAAHCEAVAAGWGIDCRVIRVTVAKDGGQGLEMAAREARYAALAALPGPGDLLFTAHHQDDQAETVLLRLLRGSGPAALAGMPWQRPFGAGTLLRPLLGESRAALEAEAHTLGLHWIEDASNASFDLDRNFLRHDILPRVAARWPACRDTLARGAQWLREQVVVEQAALVQLLQGRSGRDRYGDYLVLDGLADWGRPLRQALLRQWLQSLGLPMPSAARLQALDRDVLLAREDATGLWTLEAAGRVHAISRYRQRLYAHRPVPPAPVTAIEWASPQQPLRLGHGCLQAEAASGPGSLAVPFPLRVAFRQGGERCRPAGRAHSQTLKRLLQAHGLPPWLRDSVPLLYAGETLVAVGDCWVCAGCEARPGQPGWRIHWEIPSPSLS